MQCWYEWNLYNLSENEIRNRFREKFNAALPHTLTLSLEMRPEEMLQHCLVLITWGKANSKQPFFTFIL